MDQTHLMSGSGATDYAQGVPNETSPLSQSAQQQQQQQYTGRFNEDFDASQRGSSVVDGDGVYRSDSVMSQSQTLTPSRGGTLKKKQSVKRTGSVKRSSSRRSVGAGSVKSLSREERERYEGSDVYSAFFTPVPTKGNPTEILADRFQDWRKVLKDLITYFREVQKSHEARSKSLLSLSNLASNLSTPPGLLPEGGIGDATRILKNYHKQALQEANKAKGIEEDVMAQLTGLRGDLAQKIKEIKNLHGDFKNSVDKETETTRKAVRGYQESLEAVDQDPSAASGKGDPYIVKLGVEKQVERQIDEENYLHKAFLNLERSGRELESIVVGEIQKAYNAYAGVLKREADEAYETVENLRTGPVTIAKDREWDAFVSNNDHFVDPRMPIRKPEQIYYPGKDATAAAEVRGGMLERKSKYLKSYTPGWYVLSPTHLHEFKSADRLNSQQPVMSLYLHDQKLGSKSSADSSSHKFMLKGRQTGGMHRGHGWVFRAESHDTMLAWYEDIRNLTEKTGHERDAFVRRHARSVSAGSQTARSVSSDGGIEEDEADQVPYSATPSHYEETIPQDKAERPQPGGRFPSDLNVNRHLQMPLSPSSGTSSDDRDAIAAAGALPGAANPYDNTTPLATEGYVGGKERQPTIPYVPEEPRRYPTYETRYDSQPAPVATVVEPSYSRPQGFRSSSQAFEQPRQPPPVPFEQPLEQPRFLQQNQAVTELPHQQANEEFAIGAGGGALAGAAGTAAYFSHEQKQEPTQPFEQVGAPVYPDPVENQSRALPTETYDPIENQSRALPMETYDPITKVQSSTPSGNGITTPLGAGAGATQSAAPETLASTSTSAPALAPATPPIGTLLSSHDRLRSPAATASIMSDSSVEDQPLERPKLNSVNTVSDLHIPGEYPRTSISGPSTGSTPHP